MEISVIIVNWNTRTLLLECIESLVCDLQNVPYEIIVVDNNSSDDSVAAVRQQYPQVRLILNDSNLGFAKANNIGIVQASGKYIAFVNSDIKILPGCFLPLVRYMETHADAGCIGPRIFNPDTTYQLSSRHFPTLWNSFIEALGIHNYFMRSRFFSGEFMWLDKQKEPCDVDILSGCFWFIRAQALKRVGGLDETFFFYGEDKDYCMRYRRAGWKVIYVPEARVIHYGGASSSLRPVEYYYQLQRAYIQFWKKYYPPYKQQLFLILLFLSHGIRILQNSIFVLIFFNSRNKNRMKMQLSLKAFLWLLKNSREVMKQ